MSIYTSDMPRSRDVTVILTLCEYGDYLFTDLQSPSKKLN